ncbi:MAG: BamA/TamA family outer membrane protein [Gemmatimonadota bacterium]|nr:MAG: BamA/TamA family outer membrane protein [Gemmatimonadota bacterium]
MLLAVGVMAATAPTAEAQDSTQPAVEIIAGRGTKLAAYPYAFYSPETELAFGAGGVLTFYSSKQQADLRPSKVSLSGYYSTRKQYKFSQTTQLYLDRNRWFVSLPLEFGFYVDKYWGVGNQTPDVENEDYDVRVFSGRLVAEGPTPVPFVTRDGFMYEFSNRDVTDIKDNPYLADSVPGADGGVTSGVGYDMVKDSRDHTFFPRSGGFHRLNFLWFNSILGSDFNFGTIEGDLRRYFPVAADHVVALQLYGKFVLGQPPFYELAALGGGNVMRGYFSGRYRDRYYVATQVEYRGHVWRRFGAVVFAGVGDVFGNPESDLSFANLKYSYGFGLRLVFNRQEKINLRADFGFGKDTRGVYFGLEEAF